MIQLKRQRPSSDLPKACTRAVRMIGLKGREPVLGLRLEASTRAANVDKLMTA